MPVYLVSGKQTWEYAATGKHDLELMKACCEAETRTFTTTGQSPAPFYFARVALLSIKAADYWQAISYCQRWLDMVEQHYKETGRDRDYGPAHGPTYELIVKRLAKARAKLSTQTNHS